MLVQMISTGEETGKLDRVLEKVSSYYDQEVDAAIKTATGLIEPIMITVMGVVVGGIAMSLMLPIFSLEPARRLTVAPVARVLRAQSQSQCAFAVTCIPLANPIEKAFGTPAKIAGRNSATNSFPKFAAPDKMLDGPVFRQLVWAEMNSTPGEHRRVFKLPERVE